jgi:hypothetical protein
MPAANKFNTLALDLAHGQHNLGSNQLAIALTDTAPVAGNSVIGDISQISYTNLVGNMNVTRNSSSQTAGAYKLDLADKVLQASGGSIAQWQYVVLYNTTNNRLLMWWDKGQKVNLQSGEQTTIDFDNTNGALTM